jgi:hypothetical protein
MVYGWQIGTFKGQAIDPIIAAIDADRMPRSAKPPRR